MVESIGPRNGTNPFTGDSVATQNPINGGDYVGAGDLLEYAATFPLRQPVSCQGGTVCTCTSGDPTCQNDSLVAAGVFPGVRELRVIQSVGAHGFAASLVPKCELGDGTDPGFGENPAVDALVDYFSGVWGQAPASPSLVSDGACATQTSSPGGSVSTPPVCDPSYGCIDTL
jgi:hypothetical protein